MPTPTSARPRTAPTRWRTPARPSWPSGWAARRRPMLTSSHAMTTVSSANFLGSYLGYYTDVDRRPPDSRWRDDHEPRRRGTRRRRLDPAQRPGRPGRVIEGVRDDVRAGARLQPVHRLGRGDVGDRCLVRRPVPAGRVPRQHRRLRRPTATSAPARSTGRSAIPTDPTSTPTQRARSTSCPCARPAAVRS